MKKINILLAIVVGISIISCEKVKEKSVDELLENSKMREEIFSAILNNHKYSDSLLNRMLASEEYKAFVCNNGSMMKRMFMSEEMDSLINNDNEIMEKMATRLTKKMEADKVMCDKTCNRMMENDNVRKYLEHYSNKK
jgi:hypothetical protein